MKILDGKIVSQAVKDRLKEEVNILNKKNNRTPHLAAVLTGNNGASETYVSNKIKSCAEVGFKSTLIRHNDSINEERLAISINELNDNDEIDGILVQLPLPEHLNEEKILGLIRPDKDVDGFHPVNAGKLMLGLPAFIPATPYGIMLMLEHYKIETEGKHAVIIGRSNIVGRPLSVLLSRNSNPGNCTVTLCHSKTKNLEDICREADIIVTALGRVSFLKAAFVKQNAIVIDVGITRVIDHSRKAGYVLKGDVDFENVAPRCSYITPVPGGVGLMTIAALLMNTLKAYKDRKGFV